VVLVLRRYVSWTIALAKLDSSESSDTGRSDIGRSDKEEVLAGG
jgi:hypothetical protein